MRTTLTLDDDVARLLRERTRLTGAPFKEVVNEALRSGLQAHRRPSEPLPRFQVVPKAAGFRRGIDVLRLNQLNDAIEAEAFEQARSVRSPR